MHKEMDVTLRHFLFSFIAKARVIVTVTALAAIGAPQAASALGSDWATFHGGAVRLIASGPLRTDGTLIAGIEFKLMPGWHTYWRHPGEAGIAPQFNFSASHNIAEVKPQFPVPERYDDGFSVSIVYHDAVILPVILRAQTANAPMTLAVDMLFGVCDDICVPAEAHAVLEIPATPPIAPAVVGRLLSAEAQLPISELDGSADVGLMRLALVPGDRGPILEAEVAVPHETRTMDLFIEGAEGSYHGIPRRSVWNPTSGTAVFRMRAAGLARDGEDALPLKLLLIADTTAVYFDRILPGVAIEAASTYAR